MKYLSTSFLTLLLIFDVAANIQNNSTNNVGSRSCEEYKIGIITPPKDVDFKLTIIVPPKDIDPAMVINPCAELVQTVSTPQIIIPRKESGKLFKPLPFTIKNRYSKQ
ncbi:MAG: hypothetical protein ABR577_10305 [Pyrinomonadaceae bacterium]